MKPLTRPGQRTDKGAWGEPSASSPSPRAAAITEAFANVDSALDRLRAAIGTLRGATLAPPQDAANLTTDSRNANGVRARVAPRPTLKVVDSAVDVRGLTKRFGDQVAVQQLSFQVPQRSITGFLGPNGAGKTTTIRMLLHLAKPDAGTARILGRPIEQPTSYLSKVGALIEGPAFEPALSGAKNLRLLALLGRHPTSRIRSLLDLVGLASAGSKPYRNYSLGMKQRLGIAAALLGDPPLLILDEPTNGLDPAGIHEMRSLMQRLRSAGKTLFVSSHLIGEIERVCDHLIVIHRGRLLYQGPVHGFRSGGAGSLEERFLQLTEASSS